jgi:hypothetical protein
MRIGLSGLQRRVDAGFQASREATQVRAVRESLEYLNGLFGGER